MPPLKVNPSNYDAFRVDIVDVEAQECTTDMECAVRAILQAIGEDVDRQGLRRTPERVARAYLELTAGYHVDPVKLVNDAIFDVTYDEMVVVRDIDYWSLCEHHLLPFYGHCHVGYIPDGKVIGLSKIPRIVEMFARRLQIQYAPSEGRGRGVRGHAPLRRHARREKGQRAHGHQRHAGHLQAQPDHPRGVSGQHRPRAF